MNYRRCFDDILLLRAGLRHGMAVKAGALKRPGSIVRFEGNDVRVLFVNGRADSSGLYPAEELERYKPGEELEPYVER